VLLQLAVSYAATCGTITAGGSYTAPATGPNFCRVIATSGTQADTADVRFLASIVLRGVPYGPFALWSGTSVRWGPTPFTVSLQQNSPSTVVSLIAAARTKGQKLVLCLAGCAHDPVKTNGVFDLTLWQRAIDAYNTATIRQAIAQAVSDGTVIGNSLVDEPEIADWGGVFTKPMLDGMASYAKAYFPTLPMGVNHGGTAAYTWHTAESYRVVDYVISQYGYQVNGGDVAGYRSKVLARATQEGWTPGFSLNLLNGGTPGTACPAGDGLKAGLCRMTAAQMQTFGQTLLVGCVLVSWTYEDAFMVRADNQAAFKAISDSAARTPRKGCGRP